MEVITVILALLFMLAAIVTKAITISLLFRKRTAIAMVGQEKRRHASRLEAARAQRRVVVGDLVLLQRRKAKILKRMLAMRSELETHGAEKRQQGARSSRRKVSRAA